MENRDGMTPDPQNPRPIPLGGAEPTPESVRAGQPSAGSRSDEAAHAGEPRAVYDEADEVEEPLTVSQRLTHWLFANGFSLVVVAAIIGLIAWKFTLAEQWAILKAALGLSFVIFIHELGHFLVAKWCDVHVTTFSIGFGPAIPGCRFELGETTYKISLFPLGGYVQMIGQVDGDEASDGSEEDPRSYRNKSVGQRMAIISAGVVMNVILAVFCFIAVYQLHGKDRIAAVVGSIDSGAPAFAKGVRTGAVIERIGDARDPYFEELMMLVMATSSGEQLTLVTQRPGSSPQEVQIEPRLTREDQRPMLGIGPADSLRLLRKRDVGAARTGPVAVGSAAARAEPAFEFDDVIIGTTDPDDPTKVKLLPDDPRPDARLKDYFVYARRMQRLAGKDVMIRVERGPKNARTTVDLKVPPAYRLSLGARMQMGQVTAVRDTAPAASLLHVPKSDGEKSLEGDRIEAVTVSDADGKELTFTGATLDPERLPFQLRQWADRMEAAKKPLPWPPVRLTVRRHRSGAGQQYEKVQVELPWDDDWRNDRVVPMSASAPLPIPELGLGYQVQTEVAAVTNTDGPLKAGDVIKQIKATYVGPDGKEVPGSWSDELSAHQWARAGYAYLNHLGANAVQKIFLKVNRDQKVVEIELTPALDPSWPLARRGLLLTTDTRLQKATGFLNAISLGMKDTHNNMLQVFQNLRGMITGRLSVKNIGGPVMIATAAYRIAGVDFWEFLFFLGLISVNLAVVNFLPIPVLDGGHMVFLIYEKLRGRPASEAVRVGATYAGLMLILFLFAFVLYLDISRLFL